jgi:hypothetical protein
MTNLILLLLSMLVFGGYCFYVYKKFGVLTSISESYYQLPENLKWLFTLVTWGYSIPLMIVGSTGLAFFAGAFVCFVGAAPGFKTSLPDLENKVHVIGATGGICLAMAFIWFNLHLYPVPIIMILFTLYATSKWNKIPNHTWWIEVLAFVLMVFSLAITRL